MAARITHHYDGGKLTGSTERDDAAATVTEKDANGAVTSTRPYTAAESTAVADAAAAAVQETSRSSVAQSLRAKAGSAIAANNTFLSLASPTNAQTLAQVQRLTREANALIRLMLSQLDADDA